MKSALLLAFLLAGCAAVWDKPGSSEAEFQRDAGQCSAQGASVSNPQPFQAQSVYNYCMQGKGWYKRRA